MSQEFSIGNPGKASILLSSSTSAQQSTARTQGADARRGRGLLATCTGVFAAAQLGCDHGTAARDGRERHSNGAGGARTPLTLGPLATRPRYRGSIWAVHVPDPTVGNGDRCGHTHWLAFGA